MRRSLPSARDRKAEASAEEDLRWFREYGRELDRAEAEDDACNCAGCQEDMAKFQRRMAGPAEIPLTVPK